MRLVYVAHVALENDTDAKVAIFLIKAITYPPQTDSTDQ